MNPGRDAFAAPRPLLAGDVPAAAALLEQVVGVGYFDLRAIDERVSFVVAGNGDRLAGALVAALRAPSPCIDDPAVERRCRQALGGELPARVLHVRDLAVAPPWRRRGVAAALLASGEGAARAHGAGGALVYAWLPAGDPAPASVALYSRLGYEEACDLPDFFGDWSVRVRARCPVCGSPPCRCGVRVMVKRLG